MLVFSTQLCELLPLWPSLVFTSPPFPKSKYIIYRHCVSGRGWGLRVVLKTIFCRSLILCIWPDSEPTKLPYHPKQKPRRRGPQTPADKSLYWSIFMKRPTYTVGLVSLKIFGTCPLSSNYLKQIRRIRQEYLPCMVTTFCIAFYESYISMIKKSTCTHWGADHQSDRVL